MEAKRKSGPFEMSTDARILFNTIERLLIRDDKEFVGYDILSAAISRDVQRQARGLLQTARNNIEREYGVLLETITNEGIKLTKDREGATDRSLNHIRKTAKKTTKRVGRSIKDDQINPSLIGKLGILGAMELLSSPKAPKKLIEHIEKRKLQELSTAETLKLFSNGQKEN